MEIKAEAIGASQTKTTMITTTTKALLPSDLRNIAGSGGLLQIALDATANVNLSSAVLLGVFPFRPRMMLTLLSYCYASGIYASWDIERAIYTDKTVRYICAWQYPTWLDIRRFRRQHRDLILESLAMTIKQTWNNFVAMPPDFDEWQTEIDEEIQALARNRVETAIIMDRAEMDL
jgi:hypothetical protein